MSLSATMWTSVSGLLGHGKKMNTIGNNIANINTLGFKGQRMDFADFVYQNTNSLAGPTQNGFGVQVGSIMGNFSQGAFETTTEATDLAINGRGFFQVQAVGSDEAFFTRAGNFRFDKEGYLKDPNAFAVQGWRIDNTGGVTQAAGGSAAAVNEASGSTSAIKGSGVPTDIKLDTFSIFPQQTTRMDFKVNVPKDGADNAKNTENPFAALFNVWDGTQPPQTANTPPIATTSYAEQTTMQVFDEAGVKHTITVYFDKVSPNEYEGGSSGDEVWEYIVTMDPTEDKRQYFDAVSGELKNVNDTKAGGLLMSGTMTYNSAGALTNQSAYTWGGSQDPEANPGSFTEVPDPAGGLAPKDVLNLDPTDMNNWESAAISNNGYPIVVPNFSGIIDAQNPGTENGARYNTEINFGVKASNFSAPWDPEGSLADLNVPAYIFNTAHRPNDDTTGPEFVLLNPTYNGDLDDIWDTSTDRLSVGGAQRWAFAAGGTALHTAINAGTNPIFQLDGVTPVNIANYQRSLELYGVENITISAGEIAGAAGGAAQVPSQDIMIDLLTGAITDTDGNPIAADPTATPPILADGGINLGTPAHVDAISQEIQDRMADANPRNLYLLSPATPSNANDLAEFTEPAVVEANASTNLGSSFFSANAQDGYGFGDLTSWNVDPDGILSGVYSNGITLPLWQLTMYDFVNTQGLRREGNNLFSQTRESGEAKTGAAGTAGLGSIAGFALEQSNVDMSTEFVYMITTQRGFQSNSKLITTTDYMLETVINMKR